MNQSTEASPSTSPATPVEAKTPRKVRAAAPAPAPALAKPAAPVKPAAKAKPAAPAKPAVPVKTVAKPVAKPVAAEPAKRAKLVRDSFTMPQSDFALIDLLKAKALGFKRPTKKSELLRAGLQALAAMNAAQLKQALGSLAPLKTGRPKKAG